MRRRPPQLWRQRQRKTAAEAAVGSMAPASHKHTPALQVVTNSPPPSPAAVQGVRGPAHHRQRRAREEVKRLRPLRRRSVGAPRHCCVTTYRQRLTTAPQQQQQLLCNAGVRRSPADAGAPPPRPAPRTKPLLRNTAARLLARPSAPTHTSAPHCYSRRQFCSVHDARPSLRSSQPHPTSTCPIPICNRRT